MRKAWVAAAAAALLAGCTTLHAEHVLTGPAQAPYSGEVRIYMEGAPAPDAYDEIAIVTASGSAVDASLPRVIGALQREAAALGADAVVRVRYDHGSAGATATGVAIRTR